MPRDDPVTQATRSASGFASMSSSVLFADVRVGVGAGQIGPGGNHVPEAAAVLVAVLVGLVGADVPVLVQAADGLSLRPRSAAEPERRVVHPAPVALGDGVGGADPGGHHPLGLLGLIGPGVLAVAVQTANPHPVPAPPPPAAGERAPPPP